MKQFLFSFLAFLFCCIHGFTANAQTVGEVIANHIKAIGGKEKIKSIQTVVIKGTSTMSFARDTVKIVLSSLTRITNGKGYRIDVDAGPDGLVPFSQTTCFTDNTGPVSGWTTSPDPFTGRGTIDATPPRLMAEYEYAEGKDQIYIGNPFINYPSRETEVKLINKFNGQYCISVKRNLWAKKFYYIDINTFYISKIEEEDGLKVTLFKDYKNVSGLAFPHSISINIYMPFRLKDGPYMTTTNTVTGITTDEVIDSSIYNFPED